MIKLKNILTEALYDDIPGGDYKYKKYVAKAFDKILDEIFNFRNAMGIKQLTQKDSKLKDQFESIHQSIFDLQREMKSKGLTESDIKEFRPPGKISGEPADEEMLTPEQIEADMKEITGFRCSASQRKGLGEWRVKFYVRRELPAGDWNKAIKHITDVYGAYIDKDWTRNDYEANYEPEEPAEWTPSIYFEEA